MIAVTIVSQSCSVVLGTKAKSTNISAVNLNVNHLKRKETATTAKRDKAGNRAFQGEVKCFSVLRAM